MGLMLARANDFVRNPKTVGLGLGVVGGATLALSARRPGDPIGGDTVVRDVVDGSVVSNDPLPGTMFAGRSMLWAAGFGTAGAGAGAIAAIVARGNGSSMGIRPAAGVGVAAAVSATLAYRAGEWIVGREMGPA